MRSPQRLTVSRSQAKQATPSREVAQARTTAIRQLLDLPLSYTGLCFFRAWITLLTGDLLPIGLNGPVHDTVLATVLLPIALNANKVVPLAWKRWSVTASLGCALAAAILMVCAQAGWEPRLVLEVTGTACAAVASALYILMWCELYARFTPVVTALSIALALVGGEVVLALLNGMIVSYRLGALVVLPALSSAFLLRARSKVADGQRPQRASRHLRAPWELIVLVSLYSCATGTCIGIVNERGGLFTGIANVAAGLGLIAALVLFPQKFNLKSICQSPLVLLVPPLLLIPFAGGARGPLGAVSMAFSSVFFDLAIFLVICNIAQSQRLPAVFLFGLEEAISDLAGALGRSVGAAQSNLQWSAIASDAYITSCIAITIIATLTLFNSDALERRWGVGLFGPGRLVQKPNDTTLREACKRAVDLYGLTAREADVLLAVAQGKTISEMQNELHIARGTVKAHCEHIYTKVGVRSKRELRHALGVDGR